MQFEVEKVVARIVALWALVRFLPSVNKGMGLQSAFLSEGLVALLATEHLDLTVDLLVTGKTFLICKFFGTFFTLIRFVSFMNR